MYQRTHKTITSRSICRPRNNFSTLFSSLTVDPQLSNSHSNRRGGPFASEPTALGFATEWRYAMNAKQIPATSPAIQLVRSTTLRKFREAVLRFRLELAWRDKSSECPYRPTECSKGA